MCQQANPTLPPPPRLGSWAPLPGPLAGPVPASTPAPAVAPMPVQEGNVPRKRPLQPLEKTTHTPRAIQPRPPLSAGQFNNESGSPGPMSPGREAVPGKDGEPPRKRGRPTKAETERRKAAAEARGEEYPSRRRSSTIKMNPSTPSGAASATSESSLLSPRATVQTPEVQKLELPSEGSGGGKDTGQMDTSVQRTSESSATGEIDPVRGIILSQANRERRLPPPHEIQSRQGGFVSRASPRESFFPPRTLEAPLGGSPSPGQEGGMIRSAADQPSMYQAEGVPAPVASGPAIQSISRSGETKEI